MEGCGPNNGAGATHQCTVVLLNAQRFGGTLATSLVSLVQR